jgi:two-component system, cell cycle response regulator DivK
MTRILYVEDNEDNIYMLQSRLKRRGFEVIIARDGLEGYNTALGCSPDIILLDVGLPVMDGYEAAKKIKSDLRVCHIPIIILTAHALKEDRDKALQSGADEYETKPINLPELLKKIEGLIHR